VAELEKLGESQATTAVGGSAWESIVFIVS
jgi:hypothetical protein